MSMILSGKETAAAVYQRTRALSGACAAAERRPALAILRAGEKDSDLAYERGIRRNAEMAGIRVETHTVSADAAEDVIISEVDKLGKDDGVDGILIFLPLPGNIDTKAVLNKIPPEKDVDGAGDTSMLSIYKGRGEGFAPCTAQAVIEILDHYGIAIKGANAVIAGRSLVVGKPLANLFLARNATVTVCHSKTRDLAQITKAADILVSATGHIGTIRAENVREGQTVIDVGINFTEDGKMTGDVLFDEVSSKVAAVTPVPGGVGVVTTAVLLCHVAESAARKFKITQPYGEVQ